MSLLKTLALASVVVAGAATAADAESFGTPMPVASIQVTPVAFGYGPDPRGIYGNRRRLRARRSYGTGYRGRGTATGGPVGGLPSRN